MKKSKSSKDSKKKGLRKNTLKPKRPGAGDGTNPTPPDVWEAERNF